MRVAIGVLAEPPLPGRCLTKLLAAHTPEWVAGLHAAMLRDTLDGLQSIDAEEYFVFGLPVPKTEEGSVVESRVDLQILERHAPAPWRVCEGRAPDDSAYANIERGLADGLILNVRCEAPSALIDPLLSLIASADDNDQFVVIGPGERGDVWLYGATAGVTPIIADLPEEEPHAWAATIRVRCTKAGVTLHDLPTATIVDEPSAVLALLDELRHHPEHAPRTAQYVVTHA